MSVAYNPYDTVQQKFLAALALGETGNNPNAATEGVGGSSLAGMPTNQWGFPIWNGEGNSHAAGVFQFEPGTWDSIAQQFGLNFANSSDQAAGAWYLAQQTYAAKTGGDLETDLSSGNYTTVQSALTSVWPSVTGNAAAPQGLAADLQSGTGSNPSIWDSIVSAATSGVFNPADPSGMAVQAGVQGGQAAAGLLGSIEDWFVRGGLIIVGALIILVALWMLLSNAGVTPSPSDVAKGASKAVGAALA